MGALRPEPRGARRRADGSGRARTRIGTPDHRRDLRRQRRHRPAALSTGGHRTCTMRRVRASGGARRPDSPDRGVHMLDTLSMNPGQHCDNGLDHRSHPAARRVSGASAAILNGEEDQGRPPGRGRPRAPSDPRKVVP
ncbi:hypothetical protein KCH_02930 [Kitasatospora cheerisanensis KCTC 2395]|uniref:Uncharacterized protein n=1 Tax=Kitasatospora cheerisanensis KCTC 2395 TaxID=1348663 RepID=A0A066ZCC1_9ACTN|nr:hypothetical protein KCH_02930 [Kitasatospora cheerisanensis KCTC 2395]